MSADLKVVDIQQVPSRNCIALLEYYLEEARKGNLQQIAVAGIMRDGTSNRFASDTYSSGRVELLGVVALLSDMLCCEIRARAIPIHEETPK